MIPEVRQKLLLDIEKNLGVRVGSSQNRDWTKLFSYEAIMNTQWDYLVSVIQETLRMEAPLRQSTALMTT